MSLFSSKPSNRKRRTRRKSERSWIKDNEASATSQTRKKTASNPREKAHQLHAQIGAIETFLSKHHQAEAHRLKMKQENILPPPERSSHRRARKSVSMSAQRRERLERNRTSVRFLLLFCTACAIGWWLIFAG